MEEITRAITECQRCALAQTRIRAVPGQGPVPAALMLIGEAPGKSEDELGIPFSGAAGRVLDGMLAHAGLSRSQVFITSVIKCRPPKNRNPRRQEVDACAVHLNKQIEMIRPQVIGVMGNVALQALVGSKLTIGAVRGRVLEMDGRHYLPVFHPAALLYNRKLEEILQSDFQMLARLAFNGNNKIW